MSRKIPIFSTRRDLLKMLGGGGLFFGTCPISQVLAMLVESVISKAQAQSSGTQPRNYVLINLEGGIQHWNWDNPLQPSGSDPFISNPMVTTRFTDTQGTMSYATTTIGGVQMPHLWSLNVPAVGGGTTPMQNLLTNMLTIRGVNMEVDNHGGDNAKLVAPVPGGPSITGILADAASTNIPAVTVATLSNNPNAATAYSAPQKTGRVNISNAWDGPSNYAEALLEPFNEANLTSFRSDTYLKEKVDQAVLALQSYAQDNEHVTDPVFRDRKKAEDMFRSGIASLGTGSFTTLFAKYKDLIDRTLADRTNFTGITDQAIAGISFPFSYTGENKNALSFTLDDSEAYANHYKMEGHLAGNADLRTMLDTANIDPMAKNFALAEFLLVNGLSTSITLMHNDFDTMTGLSVSNSPETTNGTTITGLLAQNNSGNTDFSIPDSGDLKSASNKQFRADSHETGAIPGLMLTSVFYLSLSSCLLEFVDQLKATSASGGKTLFDETVIQVASEFERAPRISGYGSEHGWKGNTASFISGCIKSHTIVGNIYNQPEYSWERDGFPGTWGVGAPVQGVGGASENEILKPGHLTSSLATLLRVDAPSTAHESLVTMNSDDEAELANGIETAKNVTIT